MKLKDCGHKIKVLEASHKEVESLISALTVKAEKPQYSKAYRQKQWDGTYKFYDRRTHSFPAGLLSLLQRKLRNVNLEVDTTYKCTTTPVENIKLRFLPRDYQWQSVKTAIESRRGIIEVPTGGGKSLIISLLAKAITGKVLVIVPTKRLLTQISTTLKETLQEEIGIVGNGQYEIQRVTVAIYKSAALLSQEDLAVNCVIVDECHHVSADTYYKLLLKCPAYYRIGLSADGLDHHNVKSDKRYKRARIIGALGPIVYKHFQSDLKERGILAAAKINWVQLNYANDPKVKNLDYTAAYCAHHCFNPLLHNKVVELCKKHKDSKILIFIKHIEHGQELHKLLPEATFLFGEQPLSYINDQIHQFNDDNSDVNIIIGSPVFNEGVDIPNVDIVINAAGDVAATKQRIGRGLRQKRNKENKVIIYDFLLGSNRHIISHAKRRNSIYEKEGHEIDVV